MTKNLYLPSIVSAAVVSLCIMLLQGFRKQKGARQTNSDVNEQSDEPLLHDNGSPHDTTHTNFSFPSDVSTDPTDHSSPSCAHPKTQASSSINKTVFYQSFNQLRKVYGLIFPHSGLGFYYLAFFLKSNAMASESFVFQYLSERFRWPLSQTTVLRFALSFGAVLTTLILAPCLSSRLIRRGVSVTTVDLSIVYASLLILTICFIIAWQARSSVVFILCTSMLLV